MYSAYKTEPGIRPFPTYVFVDLENLAFLAEGLQPLSLACRTQGITFRAYCSPSHTQADRATHLSQSSEKEAADVRMTCDAAILSSFYSETDILLVTDDLWGKTLAAELKAVTHATYDGRLPPVWRARFGGEATISGYLAAFDIHRQRRDRTPSVASGARSRASWSRAGNRASRGCGVSNVSDSGDEDGPPAPRARHITNLNAIERARRGPRQGGGTPACKPSSKPRGPRRWPKGRAPTGGKQVGTISRWSDKGFGFIKPHAGGEDVFLHISQVVMDRVPGLQRQQLHQLTCWDVEFTTERSHKGLAARCVSGPMGRPLPADA